MLNPTFPDRVGPLTPLSDRVLKAMLAAAHLGLAAKLPLPEADREQWCMRLDSAVQAHNQLAEHVAVCDEWDWETTRVFKEAGGADKDVSKEVQDAAAAAIKAVPLTILGRTYYGSDASQMGSNLSQRAEVDRHTLLSMAALLMLDERARQYAAAHPSVCTAGTLAADIALAAAEIAAEGQR